MKIDIKYRWDDRTLYTGEGETLSVVLVKAVAEKANLYGADLRGANLYGANLGGANLGGANLYGANLGGADLRGADLRGANLYGANLGGANLGGADLRGANLGGANLYGAKNLIPAVILASGSWGEVSDELCADLMLWDAANHPDPESFDRWARGGECPYADVPVSRACNFREKRELWGKGQLCRPYDLMMRLLAEKCPEWTDEQIKEFEARFKK